MKPERHTVSPAEHEEALHSLELVEQNDESTFGFAAVQATTDEDALTKAIVEGRERLLRIDECAEFLGLKTSTVEKYVRSGRLRAFKWSGSVRVAASDLARFALEHRVIEARDAVDESRTDGRIPAAQFKGKARPVVLARDAAHRHVQEQAERRGERS